MFPRISLLLAVTVSLLAIQPAFSQTQQGSLLDVTPIPSNNNDRLHQDEAGWTTLTIGQSVYGIRYVDPGAVVVNNSLVMSCMPDSQSTFGPKLYVSPPSPFKKLVLVTCSHPQFTGVADAAYIIDTRNNRVASRDVVPKHWQIINWISWSPDERFALVVAAGEITDGDIAFLDLRTNRVEEIHFKNLSKNPRIKQNIRDEIQEFDPDAISWLNATTFTLRLDTHCNPYEHGNACDYEKILSSHPVQVNLIPFGIRYGNTGQVRNPRAKRRSSTSNSQTDSQTGKGIRSIDFRNFTYQSPTAQQPVQVRDGKFDSEDFSYSVEKIIYGDLTGAGREEAVVLAFYENKVAANPANASFPEDFIYTISNGQVTLLAIFDVGEIGYRDYEPYLNPNDKCNNWIWGAGGVKGIERGLLIFELAVGGRFCPTPVKYDVRMRYRWNGDRFILVGRPIKRLARK